MGTPANSETAKRPAETNQSPYTLGEWAIVARMERLIQDDIYIFTRVHTLKDPHDQLDIPDATLKRRREIVDKVQGLVKNILADRNKKEKEFTDADFDRYVNEHSEFPEYDFMSVLPPTVNKGGWGYFDGLLNPLERGVKFGPSEASSRHPNWKSGH